MSARPSILPTLRAALPGLRTRFGLTSLALFGSVARAQDHPESDIDILVTFDPAARVTLLTLAALKNALQDLLGREVDVIEDHPGLRPSFRAAITRDAVRVA